MVGKKRRKEPYPPSVLNTKRKGSDVKTDVKKFKKPEAGSDVKKDVKKFKKPEAINTQEVSRARNGGMVRGPAARRANIGKSMDSFIPRPRATRRR
jgi:hypothetical protein